MAKKKPQTCIVVEWDGDYWFWRAISARGEVEAFGGTDDDPDPSVRPDEDRMRREAGERGAHVEWDTPVEWLPSSGATDLESPAPHQSGPSATPEVETTRDERLSVWVAVAGSLAREKQ